ncbi:MAG: DUF4270 domain-containing protein [Prevotella sp.]|nr:DUF4270 domain-containing protein [Prevotella sp. Rep29]MBR1655970.1 DUF4270 domain-containing protein [Prevotella sp.]MBR3444421.1 DUF4270 domain-containing protein [Prevotella sp.]QYR11761.1 DUF4270 family protein [Prevotella sp. Rep29]
MKTKFLASMLFAVFVIAACDDNTESIGTFITDGADHLEVTADSFNVTMNSIAADSVLSRSNVGYLGKVKDPETGAYITGDFTTQFSVIEDVTFPNINILDQITAETVADSCEMRLFYQNYFGDSLATMKLTAYELQSPMKEDVNYYSNYNPQIEGLIRAGGIETSQVYSIKNMKVSEDERSDKDFIEYISIKLNDPYTDKDGNTYNNFGTYILRTYHQHPEYFKNSYNFVHNVIPGFYIKNTGGLGSMAYINSSQLRINFKYDYNDSTYNGAFYFGGTEEVLQKTTISNDKETITKLVNDNSCTYIKTPAGVFTQVTLPIDEVVSGHENDTINRAKVVLRRINNTEQSEYTLDLPQTLLMIPSDSIYSFFENGNIANYKQSFLATYSGSNSSTAEANTYTFNNIASLVSFMADNKRNGMKNDPNWLSQHPNWNKVVLIPVTATYNSSNELYKVTHDMSLTSTKLNNTNVKLYVIYSRFE